MDVKWRSGRDTVGIVAVCCNNGVHWKAYIGVAKTSDDTDADAIYIAEYGAKLSPREAEAFFPDYPIEHYVE